MKIVKGFLVAIVLLWWFLGKKQWEKPPTWGDSSNTG